MKIEKVKSKTFAIRVTKKDGTRKVYSRKTIRFRPPRLPKLERRNRDQ